MSLLPVVYRHAERLKRRGQGRAVLLVGFAQATKTRVTRVLCCLVVVVVGLTVLVGLVVL